jgi:hypothetical protein
MAEKKTPVAVPLRLPIREEIESVEAEVRKLYRITDPKLFLVALWDIEDQIKTLQRSI